MHRVKFPNTNFKLILISSLLVLGCIVGIYIGFFGFSVFIIAGIAGIMLLYLTVTRPWIAVSIFFLLIPLQNLFVLEAGSTATLTKLFGVYLAFLVIISGAIKYIKEVFNNKKVLWIILYGAIALISVLLSKDTENSLKYIITLWLSIVLYFVLNLMVRDLKTLNVATLSLLIGTVISILSPLFFGFGRITKNVWERYGGLWGDQNEFAAVLLVIMPISTIFFFIAKNRLHKVISLSCTVIIFIGFILTYSRGGFLAFIVMLIAAMFKIITGKNKTKILAIAIPCIIITFIAFYFTMADQFISRMETLRIIESRESIRAESSLNMRYYFYFELAPHLFMEHPILGVGFRDLKSYNIYDTVAHNTYLEVLTGTGLAGFIPFMMMLFLTWKELRAVGKTVPRDENQQYIKMYGNALELGFIAFLVAGFFITADLDKMLWMCVTLSAVLLNITGMLSVNYQGSYNRYYQQDHRKGLS